MAVLGNASRMAGGILPIRQTKLGVANTRIGGLHICRSKIGGVFHEGKR